jgi:hypothetical protein
MKKNKAVIVHHQGFGDLFTNNSLCHYYAEMYDEIEILTYTESRLKVLEYMYKDYKKIKCSIAPLHSVYDGKNSCINCMTYGSSRSCPRGDIPKCLYIDFSKFKDYDHIKSGCFNNFSQWINFYKNEKLNQSSFSHAFYKFNNLSEKTRIEKFSVSRNLEEEDEKYQNFLQSIGSQKYIVVHEDNNRGLGIGLQSSMPVYNLDKKSSVFLDQIKIIENAEEIHFIDSSYSVLIYFLSFINDKIKNKPKYLHGLGRSGRDIAIYKDPIPKNWKFI